jgi:hypothetical protein
LTAINATISGVSAGQIRSHDAIHRYGYAGVPEVAHEAMLLRYLDL